MGFYDTLELPAALTLPELDRDPSTLRWQTKSIGVPAMRTFRITADGRLLQEETHTEEVPEEERPTDTTDTGDGPFFQLAGSIRTVHDGWSERRYHGVIRFVTSVDDDLLEYHAKFTDGRLVALRPAGDDTDSECSVEAVIDTDTSDRRPTDRLSEFQHDRLESLLDELDAELDAIYDADAGIPGGLDGRGYKRWLQARNGVTNIRTYLDWRADTDGPP